MRNDWIYENNGDYQSKYFYPGTEVLINKYDIRNREELEKTERVICTWNLSKMILEEVSGLFGVDHYLDIHKKIFGNIYSFAGEIRDECIAKGGITFCLPNFIFNELKSQLEIMRKTVRDIKNEDDLINYLADSYANINIIHPFMEGNGRTEREFLRQFVIGKINQNISFGEYNLDYSLIGEEERKYILEGSKLAAVKGDISLLKEFFKNTLVNKKQKHL